MLYILNNQDAPSRCLNAPPLSSTNRFLIRSRIKVEPACRSKVEPVCRTSWAKQNENRIGESYQRVESKWNQWIEIESRIRESNQNRTRESCQRVEPRESNTSTTNQRIEPERSNQSRTSESSQRVESKQNQRIEPERRIRKSNQNWTKTQLGNSNQSQTRESNQRVDRKKKKVERKNRTRSCFLRPGRHIRFFHDRCWCMEWRRMAVRGALVTGEILQETRDDPARRRSCTRQPCAKHCNPRV